MQKEKKEKHFIDKPTYVGGKKAMLDFIKSNLQYPQAALDAQVEGSVHIRYSINHKGEVISANIINGIGHGCNEEALRVVKLMQFTKTRNRKLKIKFNNKISIHFHLPQTPTIETLPQTEATPTPAKEAPTSPPPQRPAPSFSYTVTPQKKTPPTSPDQQEQPKPQKGGTGYTFTIKIG